MFADALERAINSNEQTASDVPDLPWEEHPVYDHDDVQQVSDPTDVAAPDDTHEEVAWEDHPYYDDLGSPETDRGEDDELDRSQNSSKHTVDQQESDDEVVPEDAQEVAWEDHPHYDTPAEEEDQLTDSDVPEDEEDVAWEDSPYY